MLLQYHRLYVAYRMLPETRPSSCLKGSLEMNAPERGPVDGRTDVEEAEGGVALVLLHEDTDALKSSVDTVIAASTNAFSCNQLLWLCIVADSSSCVGEEGK